MPASKHSHMGRKGISYSPKRGINASGVRLTAAVLLIQNTGTQKHADFSVRNTCVKMIFQ